MIWILLFLFCADVFALLPKDTIPGYARKMGFPVEDDHFATTDDGYILHLFRFPRPGAPVVYLQHGILASAWCWLVNVPERSAGFVLYEMGYDVWFGNSRGNSFSRNHTTLSPKDDKFWNYTFTQMAKYDIPTQVDYILKHSGRSNLTYVGWSQGFTQLLIAGSNHYVDPSKFNLAVGVSPVSYLRYSSSLLLTTISRLHLGDLIYKHYHKGFLDGSPAMSTLEEFFCRITFGVICSLGVDTVCGHSKMDDSRAITNLTAHFPAGTSTKDMIHYEQFINDNYFRDFDYGKDNAKIYGSDTPPAFDIGSFNLPVALFGGTHDDLVSMKDLQHLHSELPPATVKAYKTYDTFSHLTWLVGKAEAWVWFQDLMALLVQYNPV